MSLAPGGGGYIPRSCMMWARWQMAKCLSLESWTSLLMVVAPRLSHLGNP